MSRRYFFFVIFALLTSSLSWWEGALKGLRNGSGDGLAVQRREIVEFLDRVVAWENSYRSVSGKFSASWEESGVILPRTLREAYQLDVLAASATEFKLAAIARNPRPEPGDRIEVDQAYRVNATFAIPAPRPEYLRSAMSRHLAVVRAAAPGPLPEPVGIYRDYFRVDARSVPGSARKAALAIGVRPPVLGLQVELAGETGQRAALDAGDQGGALVSGPRRGAAPEALLGDLARIAEVRWAEDLSRGGVPESRGNRSPAQLPTEKPGSSPSEAEPVSDSLIVEPISAGEKN